MRLAFLVYVSRSGSTLLAHRLATATADVVVLPELRLPEILLLAGDPAVRTMDEEKLEDLFSEDRQYAALGLSDEDHRAVLAAAPGGIAGILETLAERYAGRRPAVAVYKLGALLHYTSQLQALFAECCFVHVYRDVRGVASSMINAERPYFPGEPMGRGDVVHIARTWTRYLALADEKRLQGLPLLEVAYEALVGDTDAIVNETLGFLGAAANTDATGEFAVAPAERELHRLAGKPPEAGRVTGWREELAAWQGVTIEQLAGPAMQARGFDPWFGPRCTAGKRWRAGVRAWFAHAWLGLRFYLRRLGNLVTRPRETLRRLQARLRRGAHG